MDDVPFSRLVGYVSSSEGTISSWRDDPSLLPVIFFSDGLVQPPTRIEFAEEYHVCSSHVQLEAVIKQSVCWIERLEDVKQ